MTVTYDASGEDERPNRGVETALPPPPLPPLDVLAELSSLLPHAANSAGSDVSATALAATPPEPRMN
jgi:hypothetical protein